MPNAGERRQLELGRRVARPRSAIEPSGPPADKARHERTDGGAGAHGTRTDERQEKPDEPARNPERDPGDDREAKAPT